MSLIPQGVAAAVSRLGANPEYYFELQPAQQLELSGNTLSITHGNSVDIADATTVAQSAQKLTAVSYHPGLLATTVDGLLTVGNGSIIGSTDIEGGRIAVTRTDSAPTISLNAGSIAFDGSGFIFDPPLPGGGGVAAVAPGSNIAVTGSASSPVVNVAVSTDLDMHGNNIRNGVDIDLAGTNPSVNFFDSSSAQKASVDYVEVGDRVTMSGANVSLDTTQAGYPRVILDGGGVTVRANDRDVALYRFESTGAVASSALKLTNEGVMMTATNTVTANLDGNGLTVAGDPTIGAKPTITLQNSNSGNSANLNYDGSDLTLTGDIGSLNLNAATTNVNGGGGLTVNGGGGLTVEVPNETRFKVQAGGIVAIDNTGLTAGNDPILSLKEVSGAEARITRTSTGPLNINNDGDAIHLQVGSTTTMTINSSGNVGVGGSGNDGSLFLVKGDGSDYAAINYDGANYLNIQNNPGAKIQTLNSLLDFNGSSGNINFQCGGTMEANFGGGTNVTTPNFTVNTNGSGYIEMGDVSYGNNHTRMIINDGEGTIGFGGDLLLAAGAGGSSGQYLNITINGSPFKIALLSP